MFAVNRILVLAVVAVIIGFDLRSPVLSNAASHAGGHSHDCTCPGDEMAPAPARRRLFASHTAGEEMCKPCGAGAEPEAEAEAESTPAAEGEPSRRLSASHEAEECAADPAARRRLMASHLEEEGEHHCCCPDGTMSVEKKATAPGAAAPAETTPDVDSAIAPTTDTTSEAAPTPEPEAEGISVSNGFSVSTSVATAAAAAAALLAL